ncbi:MAG: hypothetical protein K8L97_08580 [Anaerolineae bacterium]|nr:hypothetical protein [Anaerolineae bacterium]
MTLVVAKKILDNIVIVSDTKVILEQRSSLLNADESLIEKLSMGEPEFDDFESLKILILSPQVCIAFAGNTERALNIIRTLFEKKQHIIIADLLNLLKKEVSEDVPDNRRVEFIVAHADKTECNLYLVQDRKIKDDLACWIGSYDAFAEYQRLFPRMNNKEIGEFQNFPSIHVTTQLGLMLFTMRRLIEDDIEHEKGKLQNSVGGFALAVKTTPNGFRYVTQNLNSHGPQSHVVITSAGIGGSSIVDDNMIDGADTGGYTYSILTPKEPGQCFIGVYIYQNKIGMLYAPLLHKKRTKLKDLNLEDFVNQVLQRFNVLLEL